VSTLIRTPLEVHRLSGVHDHRKPNDNQETQDLKHQAQQIRLRRGLRYPIMISFARKVGMLMTELSDNQTPNPSYRFYI
jgi:hypothetical protein